MHEHKMCGATDLLVSFKQGLNQYERSKAEDTDFRVWFIYLLWNGILKMEEKK
jgi:hypothetical protein